MGRYLADLRVRIVVTEYEYTDRDFLDDFANYYVKCFTSFERRCRRLHFFCEEFSEPEFIALVAGNLDAERRKAILGSYRGFVVARPLPDAVVGRTVLATYPNDAGRRHYEATRGYSANLFGVDLACQSLAFQEQDRALAACATVSLWSCLHKTADLFGTSVLTPAEITRLANIAIHPSRPIPSRGLNVQQMCSAIKQVGLEPEVFRVSRDTPLLSLIYAYASMGLPVLLGAHIEGRDLHAIAIAGYSLMSRPHLAREASAGSEIPPMAGRRINEFYAHDDQIGPFSRLVAKLGAVGGVPKSVEKLA